MCCGIVGVLFADASSILIHTHTLFIKPPPNKYIQRYHTGNCHIYSKYFQCISQCAIHEMMSEFWSLKAYSLVATHTHTKTYHTRVHIFLSSLCVGMRCVPRRLSDENIFDIFGIKCWHMCAYTLQGMCVILYYLHVCSICYMCGGSKCLVHAELFFTFV